MSLGRAKSSPGIGANSADERGRFGPFSDFPIQLSMFLSSPRFFVSSPGRLVLKTLRSTKRGQQAAPYGPQGTRESASSRPGIMGPPSPIRTN
jgi:hypothetical protein